MLSPNFKSCMNDLLFIVFISRHWAITITAQHQIYRRPKHLYKIQCFFGITRQSGYMVITFISVINYSLAALFLHSSIISSTFSFVRCSLICFTQLHHRRITACTQAFTVFKVNNPSAVVSPRSMFSFSLI